MSYRLMTFAAALLVAVPVGAEAPVSANKSESELRLADAGKDRVTARRSAGQMPRWHRDSRAVGRHVQQCTMPPLMRMGNAVAAIAVWAGMGRV